MHVCSYGWAQVGEGRGNRGKVGATEEEGENECACSLMEFPLCKKTHNSTLCQIVSTAVVIISFYQKKLRDLSK